MIRIILILLILSVSKAIAQSGTFNRPEIYEFNAKDCFKNVRYSGKIRNDSVRPNSILTGQRIWRTISLENKEKTVLFKSNTGCDQIGFFEIIKYGLFEKKLNVFHSDNFDEAAKSRFTNAQLLKKISYVDSSEVMVYDADGNEKKTTVIEKRYLFNKDIKTYLLKEDWIMNSHTGEYEKKIIALAPLIYEQKKEQVLPLFWLYYNEWKELFASFEAKNYYTEFRITYKDVFENKYFISRISKESNIFERLLKAYKSGQDIDAESEVIKEKVIKSEKDLFQN
jgi:hypothetical protein